VIAFYELLGFREDGHGHMVAEPFEGSVGSEPPR
jgi:hypothetical protein